MRTLFRGLYLLAFLVAASNSFIQSAGAQNAGNKANSLTTSDLARISDSELRALVLKRLAPASTSGSSLNPAIVALNLKAALEQVNVGLRDILGAYGGLPGAFATAWSALTSGRQKGGIGQFFLIFAVSIVVAWGVERLVRRRIGMEVVNHPAAPTLKQKVGFLLRRILSHFLYAALFAGAAAAVFFAFHSGEPRDGTTFAFYLSAIVMIQLVARITRTYLGLDLDNMRIPALATDAARRIHTVALVTIALGTFGFFTCALFGTLGIHGNVHLLMLMMVGSVMAVGLAVTFFVNRHAFSADLANQRALGTMRHRFAVAYPWIMSIGTLLLWGILIIMALLDQTPLFGAALMTIGLFTVLPGVDAAAEREAERHLAANDQVTPEIIRVIRIAGAVATMILLAIVWRVDLVGASGLGAAAVRSLLEVGVVLLLAYAVWQILRLWVDKKIADEDSALGESGVDMSEAEIGGTGLSRMRTLLPLFKRTGQITVGVITLMVVLSSLGVNIGPILAGAGVLGLAIGFGSQTLVRDIVSGVFFLMDDAFRLGEYIDLGSVKGSVEKITIRALQLRHHRGALHTVPFGEMKRLTNYSRDWAIMKLRFRVPFDTDLEKARKIIKTVGKDLLEHPEIGPDFIQPFKSQGVVEVDDYGLVISTKFMSKPGKQFLIRRHAYAAIQRVFAENGIEFARPEIHVSMDRADDDRSERAAAAAALSRVNQPKPETADA